MLTHCSYQSLSYYFLTKYLKMFYIINYIFIYFKTVYLIITHLALEETTIILSNFPQRNLH